MLKLKIIIVCIAWLLQLQTLRSQSNFEFDLPYSNSKILEIATYQNKIIVTGEINENYYDVFIAIIDTSTKQILTRNYSSPNREIHPRLQIINDKIYLLFWEYDGSIGDKPIINILDINLNVLLNTALITGVDFEIYGSTCDGNQIAYVGQLGPGNSDFIIYFLDKNGNGNYKVLSDSKHNWFYEPAFDLNNNLALIGGTDNNIASPDVEYNYSLFKFNPITDKVLYSLTQKTNYKDVGKGVYCFGNENINIGNSSRNNIDNLQVFNLSNDGNIKYNYLISTNNKSQSLIVNGSCKDGKYIYICGQLLDNSNNKSWGFVMKLLPDDCSIVFSKISKIENLLFTNINLINNDIVITSTKNLANQNYGISSILSTDRNGNSCYLDSLNLNKVSELLILTKINENITSSNFGQAILNINNNLAKSDLIVTKCFFNPCLSFELVKTDYYSGCGIDSIKLSVNPNPSNYMFSWNTSETTNSIIARKTGKYKVYIRSIDNLDCVDSIDIDIEINNNSNSGGKLNKLIVDNESYTFSSDTVFSNNVDCRKIKFKNISNVDITINEQSFSINKQYSLPSSQFPLKIKAKDSVNLVYCFNSNISGIFRDTLIIFDECNPHKLKFVAYSVIPDKVGSNKCNSEYDLTFNKKLIEKNIKFLNSFPNPINDNLNISFEIEDVSTTESLDFEYTIYNIIGMELVKDYVSIQSIDNNLCTLTIPFLNLSKGNYFIKVKHLSFIKSFWIIKD